MPATFSCIVTGRVQGVFFRAWTRDTALSLGLTGWVHNRLDGSVELQAQGPDEAVASLAEQLHDGPPHARVDRVDCRITDIPEQFSSFVIRR